MNFFLDENFPKKAEDYLNSIGHKTSSFASEAVSGIDDKSIFQLAQQKKSIFLTTDKDFFHTIPFLFKEHFGVIVITLNLPNREKIIEKLKWAIENLDLNNFNNKVVLLRDKTYTIR